VAARRYAPFPEQISFEAIVGTDAGQQVVAPGALRRTWTKAGRRYFHYATDAPSGMNIPFSQPGTRCRKENGKPIGRSGAGGYHPDLLFPGLTENPERMVRSAQASLDYFAKHFGPYPHRQLRFVAHPGYYFGNHAAPINIYGEEGFFLLNPKDDPRGFDLVTAAGAHEVAHSGGEICSNSQCGRSRPDY
jgi:hypothetical protein